MRCGLAQLELSARMDGEIVEPPAVEPRALGPAGTRHARRGRSRRAVSVAAALVAGAVIGSVLVGGPFRVGDRPVTSSTAVVRGVRAAAPGLDSFQGTYEVVERGFSPEVPLRRLDVHLAFLAPQRFRLDVIDRTSYPS